MFVTSYTTFSHSFRATQRMLDFGHKPDVYCNPLKSHLLVLWGSNPSGCQLLLENRLILYCKCVKYL